MLHAAGRTVVAFHAVAGPSRYIACTRCARGAATAAAAQGDDEQARLRQRHEQYKGKARDEEWDRFRFPKARDPGPFEVLHLGRNASGAEVKERCGWRSTLQGR